MRTTLNLTAIDPSYFNELNFKNSILDSMQTVFYNCISQIRFSLNLRIRTRIINGINKKLKKHHLLMTGIIQEVTNSEYTKEDIDELYPVVTEALNTFRKSHSKFEKVNFLNNEETKLLSKTILKDLYKIESALRRKLPPTNAEAFADEKEILQKMFFVSEN